ncbi:MAG: hypothetical protein J2O49_08700, partial [Sciscionella sp.]|nr:hypothetical protein [Sciscionella sp.]
PRERPESLSLAASITTSAAATQSNERGFILVPNQESIMAHMAILAALLGGAGTTVKLTWTRISARIHRRRSADQPSQHPNEDADLPHTTQ